MDLLQTLAMGILLAAAGYFIFGPDEIDFESGVVLAGLLIVLRPMLMAQRNQPHERREEQK